MKECKDCELAVYCFSESSTWIFRTKQEMEEKLAAIAGCPRYQKAHPAVCMSRGEETRASSS